MRTILAMSVLVVAAIALGVSAEAQCDPTCTSSPAPVPARLAHRCGNGRIDTVATTCERSRCGGCGLAPTSSVSCDEHQELCDGTLVGSESCTSLGFAGGAIGCGTDCASWDTHACQPCFAGPRVTCGSTPLTGLVDVEAIGVAPSDSAIGVVFSAHRATRIPEDGWTDPATLFVAIFESDLRVRAAPHEIGRTDWGGVITATRDGFLVGTTDGQHTTISFVDPRTGAARVVHHADAAGRLLDLARTPAGEILVLRSVGDAFLVDLLDTHGEPLPLPSTPIHALSDEGRVVVIPMGDGTLPMPRRWQGGALAPAGSIDVHAGDRLVVFAGRQFGAMNEVEVEIVRDGARLDGYRADAGTGTMPAGSLVLDLALPGGARVTMRGGIDGLDDRITDASGASLVHVTGAGTARDPGITVFGGTGVETHAFTPAPHDDVIGLAIHPMRLAHGYEASQAWLELVLARVTPPTP